MASNIPASQCWVPVAGAPALSQISVGSDGSLAGIKSGTNYVVYYSAATKAWVTTTLSATQVVAVNSDLIFFLGTQGHINQFIPSTGSDNWYGQPYPATITKISVGKDGDVWMIDNVANGCGSGRTWHYDSAHAAWLNENEGLSNISVVNQGLVFGSCSTGVLFKWTPDSNWVSISGTSTRVFAAPTQAVEDSTNYVLYGINSSGNPIHQNATGWDTETGIVTSLGVGNEDSVYGLFGTTLERFASFTVSITHNIQGAWGPNPVCNCVHTLTSNVSVGGNQFNNQNSVPYQQFTSVNTTGTVHPNDTISCLENGTNCPTIETDSNTGCNEMGSSLYHEVKTGSLQVELDAETRVIQNGGYSNCTGSITTTCDIAVTEWCTPNTTPPDYHVTQIRDMVYPFSWHAWDAHAHACARLLYSDGTKSPWVCTPGGRAQELPNGTTPPFGICTSNP